MRARVFVCARMRVGVHFSQGFFSAFILSFFFSSPFVLFYFYFNFWISFVPSLFASFSSFFKKNKINGNLVSIKHVCSNMLHAN